MEGKIAREFNEKVQTLIIEESDRDGLYSALRTYQRGHDLKQLILNLKNIISKPALIPLYDAIRRLIPLKHQVQYDRLVPRKPSEKLRVIRLHRKNNEGLGFAVRGGLEHGVGVFVSHVTLDSQAHEQGLRVGDEIVRLNGFTISQAIHDEVLSLIKSKTELLLKVRNIGMIPVREKPDDTLSWKYVDTAKTLQQVLDGNSQQVQDGEELKLFINLPLHVGLGCSICSGAPEKPGIFIQSIQADSLAVALGLEVGDQILNCNDTNFHNISHSQAVVALKGSRQLEMLIKKGAGGEYFGGKKRTLSEEEDRAMQLQMLINQKQREKVAERQEMYRKKGTNRSNLSMKKNDRGSLKYDPDYETVTYKQEDLIQQALLVLEEKEQAKARESQTLPDPASISDPKPQEGEAAMANPVASAEAQVAREPVIKQPRPSVVYMSDEPSFRFQKPVLLHPSTKSVKKRSPPVEQQFPPEEFTEENFTPHRIFTNEQIAGRQIRLVNIRKDGSRDLGMIIESVDPQQKGKIMVAEVYEGGAIHKQGGIHVGDELMIADQHSLLNVTVDEAQHLLRETFTGNKQVLQLVIAKAPPSDLGEEVTYF